MDFEALLLHPPSLHTDRNGNLVSWRAGERLLRYMNAKLTEGDVTLETGAGLTTIVFAMKRCSHTVVVPDQGQADRIREWCTANGVQSDSLTFAVQPSEDVLPHLDPGPLDLVLIDGGHGFPTPFIDWFYAGRRLRPGGTLIVDDMNVWTSRVLHDFLAKESQWRIDHAAAFEFFAATREAVGPAGEWLDQPYVLQHSYYEASTSIRRRTVAALARSVLLSRSAIDLAQRREWHELRRRLAAAKRDFRADGIRDEG